MNWKTQLHDFFVEYQPTDNPGSKHKYVFAVITKLKVFGRQPTKQEIKMCPKIHLNAHHRKVSRNWRDQRRAGS
jgi:hypothetical protein